MAVVKKKLMNPSHVLIFVEGDTDEVFFKALIDYYVYVSVSRVPLKTGFSMTCMAFATSFD